MISTNTESEEPAPAIPPGMDPESAADPGVPPVSPSSDPAPTIPSIFLQTSSVGDSAAAVDELGFELYVNALADFLVAPNTHAPLTCSIEGSWGSGKSSFMLQLRNRLEIISPNSRSVEFNAWKYDKQEELWAAFALKVARSLRQALPWKERLRGDFHLFRSRIKGWSERLSLLALVLTWLLLLSGFFGVIVWTIGASHPDRVKLVKSLAGSKVKAEEKKPAPTPESPALPDPWVDWLSWSPLATSAVLIVLLVGKIPESLRKRLFEAQLEKYIDRPDYKGKAAFVDAFSDDFAKTIASYAPAANPPAETPKIFVFIDDLDRCEAPKAADLMQAINLLIGDGGNPLIFILGLDRAKVAAAIAFKFREIIPFLDDSPHPSDTARDTAKDPAYLRNYGNAFLEKFIQLSFRLPVASSESQARTFIDSLITDPAAAPAIASTPSASPAAPTPQQTAAAKESHHRALRIESGVESQRIKDIVMMVREVLEYSPRRIKTFLNAFRLALYIASAQGLLDVDKNTGEAEVTPETLGKFLALTSRFSDLRTLLDSDFGFLGKLEDIALVWRSDDKTLHDLWLEKPGVRKLMSFGIPERTLTRDWQRQYSMKNFPAWKFDTVLPSIPPPKPPTSVEPQPTATASAQPPANFQIPPIDMSAKSGLFSPKILDPNATLEDILPGAAALHRQLIAEGRIPPDNTPQQVPPDTPASTISQNSAQSEISHAPAKETAPHLVGDRYASYLASSNALPTRRGNRGDSQEKTQKLPQAQKADIIAEHELEGLLRNGAVEDMPAE